MEYAPTVSGTGFVRDILNEFRQMKFVLAHALSDISSSSSKAIYHTCDYDLIYPWLWPGADTKSPQYDLTGRNIFALFPRYHQHVDFRICFTVPSILEFLDTIEHRYANYTRLSESGDDAEKILSAFKAYMSRDFDEESSEGVRIKSFILNLKLGSEDTNLRKVMSLFRRNVFTLAHEHLDIASLVSWNQRVQDEYRRIFAKMDHSRSPSDPRPIDDKQFHYKVNSWNIAFRLVNATLRDHEITHVCRETIRNYYPGNESEFYSRHPLVLLYQLYALLRSAGKDNIREEANDFLRDAAVQISSLIVALEKSNADHANKLTSYLRDRIDEVHNKFARPLFYDYNNGGKILDAREIQRMREEAALGVYRSITTADGFRDRFKQGAQVLRQAAHELADVAPVIVDSRLLEPYELANNPRVNEILRSLSID